MKYLGIILYRGFELDPWSFAGVVGPGNDNLEIREELRRRLVPKQEWTKQQIEDRKAGRSGGMMTGAGYRALIVPVIEEVFLEPDYIPVPTSRLATTRLRAQEEEV